MTTLDELLGLRGGTYQLDVRIDGFAPYLSNGDLGAANNDARYRLCVRRPTWASTQPAALWLETLAAYPDIMGEAVDVFGGFPQHLGRLTIHVLDHQDLLTSVMRTESTPLTLLAEDLDNSETAIDVLTGSRVPDDSVIYIGAEEFRVTNVAANTLTADRGYGGTDALTHATGDKVYAYTPYLLGRRMELTLGSDDEQDEHIVGEYVIDQCRWDPTLNVWIIGGRSQLKYLDRVVPRVPRAAKLVRHDTSSNMLLLEQVLPTGQGAHQWAHWTGAQLDSTTPPTTCFVEIDGEIIGCQAPFRTILSVSRRGVTNTPVIDLAEARGEEVRQVMVSDRFTPGASFRWAPGPSPPSTLNDAAWQITDNWVDLMLCIMTSPAGIGASADFAPGGNGDATYGNWSSLPGGFGLGIPVDQIDLASFLAVRARTTEFRFPRLVFGRDDATSAAELIDVHWLRPMGATMAVVDGLITLVLARLPLVDESTNTITTDDVLQAGELLDAEVGTNTQLLAPGVTYRIGPDATPFIVNNADYADTYGQRGYYVTDADNATIDVPSGAPELGPVYGGVAQSRLFRLFRPNIEVTARVHAQAAWDHVPGTLTSVTIPELPDRTMGTRGWTGILAQVLEREISLEDGTLTGSLRILGYGAAARIGRITPAARIASIASNVFTVNANRYTSTDAATNGLPDTDAEAFQQDDQLILVDRAGAIVSGSAEEVVSVSGNDITLSGNFGGAGAASMLLIFAPYDSVGWNTTRRNRYAWFADRATITVGTAGQAYVYGEA